MLSLGGVNHLTGGTKREGLVTMETLLALCSGEPAELSVDEGADLTLQAGKPPVDQRHGRGADAGGLRVRDDRHVRAAVVRARGRGRGGRRPHHRGALRTPGGSLPGHPADRDQGQGPPLDPREVLQRREPGHRLGRNRYRGPAHDPRRVRSGGGPARVDAADDRHDRRAPRVLRAGRRAPAGGDAAARRPASVGRADPRELRAGHDLGPVHGGRGRLAPRRRDRESGRADPLGRAGPSRG